MRDREVVYRNYVTDALRIITENTAKLGGRYLTTRFADIGKVREIPKQTAQETARDIIKRLNDNESV